MHTHEKKNHLRPVKSICLHSNTKIAAGYNCQGISNHYMDLYSELMLMKTFLSDEGIDPVSRL